MKAGLLEGLAEILLCKSRGSVHVVFFNSVLTWTLPLCNLKLEVKPATRVDTVYRTTMYQTA